MTKAAPKKTPAPASKPVSTATINKTAKENAAKAAEDQNQPAASAGRTVVSGGQGFPVPGTVAAGGEEQRAEREQLQSQEEFEPNGPGTENELPRQDGPVPGENPRPVSSGVAAPVSAEQKLANEQSEAVSEQADACVVGGVTAPYQLAALQALPLVPEGGKFKKAPKGAPVHAFKDTDRTTRHLVVNEHNQWAKR